MIPSKRLPLILAISLLLIIGIAITFSLIPQEKEQQQRPQNIRNGTTILSFIPDSSTTSPLKKTQGDKVNLDLMVNPGTDAITFIKFQLTYDPNVLELDKANPFTVESTTFSGFTDGPLLETGQLSQSVSIGFDPTKAITQPTKVGILHFKIRNDAKANSTTIRFTDQTQILSAGSDAAAAQNVLSQTKPAVINIDSR